MDEVEVTSTMSRLLLENMLPKHVVGIIMDPRRNKDVKIFHWILNLDKINYFKYIQKSQDKNSLKNFF